MPYRKHKKAPRRRRNYKGRRNYKRKNRAVVKSMAVGFPDRVRVKLKYSDTIALTGGASGTALQVFRGNSIYDPDLTNTGHQPLYHDNYTAIYEKYVVRGCKIQIKAINHSSSDACVLMCVASTEQFAVADVNTTTTMEQNLSKRTVLIPIAARYPASLSMYTSTAKVQGLRPGQVTMDDQNGAIVNNNPSSLWYYNIGALFTSGTAAQVVRIQVLLTYYVEFFDRLKQSQN